MISVQNHRPLLNGSNFLIAVIIASIFSSCAVSKKSTGDSNVQIIKADTAKKKLPAENKENKKTSPAAEKNVVKTDTLKWKDVSPSYKPIQTGKAKKADNYNKNNNQVFKDEYNITLLLPLDSDQSNLPSDTRFLQFYAGMLMGLELLEKEGIQLKTKVIDTNEGNQSFIDRVETILKNETDLIIGPYEREDIKIMAEKCKEAGIPIVSPWQTSTKITSENPYYIQIKPNLKDHFKKLAESTVSQYKPGEVAIIVKNNKESSAWVDHFQENAVKFSGIENFYIPLYIDLDTLRKGKAVFSKLMGSGLKAVILPSYSYDDEDYIIAALKRLGVDKGSRSIDVYGMPLIYESDKIDYEYYHTLNINVVMSEDGGQDINGILKFKKDYLQKYGEIPGDEAIRAYDLINYVGRNLWKHGKTFQNFLWQEDEKFLLTRFNVVKSWTDDSKVNSVEDKFDYFENKYLHILNFKDNTWQIKY
ncbi:MAG: amino acid ABC transporter substrate-binding protein [Saprospiraceae bacterium]|jgi:ABC-type branched-subunit amino acid transport system substrate-binding protein|nr:amino acid ABC transporter substrate-binding protein [Saprospiraceae bacterium]